MKNLLFAGVATTLALATAPAMAASDSFEVAAKSSLSTAMDMTVEGGRPHGPRPMVGNGNQNNHRWGHRVNGRWFAGFSAPGGWLAYRQPYRGFVMPNYWLNSSYAIGNYRTYGLYAPMTGYGWTRYYDDAVLSDYRGNVYDHRSGIDWNRYEGGYAADGYQQPDYAPEIAPDRQVYDVNGGYPQGAYDQNRYEQDVEYREGTGAPYAPPPVANAPYKTQPTYGPAPYGQASAPYSTPYGYERYERCLKDRGIGGGVLGAVIGAVAGNRIAGRGDRLAGSLIGGGVGALAGMGIEKATDKCRRHLPKMNQYPSYGPSYPQYGPAYPSHPPVAYPAPQPYPPQGYGYQSGYYYAPQAPMVVTTVTMAPSVVTTTTVTEETYYESVPVRHKAVRKIKPRAVARPKPRCTCR